MYVNDVLVWKQFSLVMKIKSLCTYTYNIPTVHFWSLNIYTCISVGRYWEMVERLRVKQFYGAPTAIRLLLKAGDHHVRMYDRSSLTTLGCG